jgi:hypothetical protein
MEKKKGQNRMKNVQSTERNPKQKKIDENFISNFPSDFISTKIYCDNKKRQKAFSVFVKKRSRIEGVSNEKCVS